MLALLAKTSFFEGIVREDHNGGHLQQHRHPVLHLLSLCLMPHFLAFCYLPCELMRCFCPSVLPCCVAWRPSQKSAKWSERKSAVAELTEAANKVRIAPGDFSEVNRALKKVCAQVCNQ